MFCVNVLLTVKSAEDVDEIRDLLTTCGRMSRDEPGCLSYEACHSQSDPTLFILCERWESEQAWSDHREREAVQTIYLPKVIPKVDRVPHISTILE